MNPFWIKKDGLRLAIAPRPRGYDWLVDDIRLLKRAEVDLLVSALTHAEAEDMGDCLRSVGVAKTMAWRFSLFPLRTGPFLLHSLNLMSCSTPYPTTFAMAKR
jgi:hypothetical protein